MLNKGLKKFIEDNTDLIKDCRFYELFATCPDEWTYMLSTVLDDAGIDYSSVFKDFANNYLNHDKELNELVVKDADKITISELDKQVTNLKNDLSKFAKILYNSQETDAGLVYKKYKPLADKCLEIYKAPISNSFESTRLRNLCKTVDFNFPYGWKGFENYYTNTENILDIGRVLR